MLPTFSRCVYLHFPLCELILRAWLSPTWAFLDFGCIDPNLTTSLQTFLALQRTLTPDLSLIYQCRVSLTLNLLLEICVSLSLSPKRCVFF